MVQESRLTSSPNSDNPNRAKLIADILIGVFGNDVGLWLDDGPSADFGKAFDESKIRRHPKGSRTGGRFAPKNSAEAVAATYLAIDDALKGNRTKESAGDLMHLLSMLTVAQLTDIKKKYQLSASGKVKADLVKKIAERLDSGRRTIPEIVYAHDGAKLTEDELYYLSPRLRNLEREHPPGSETRPAFEAQIQALRNLIGGKPLTKPEYDIVVDVLQRTYNRANSSDSLGSSITDRISTATEGALEKLGVNAKEVWKQQVGKVNVPLPVTAAEQPIRQTPKFTSAATGNDYTPTIRRAIALPGLSHDIIDSMVDVVPHNEHDQLVGLIAQERPEFAQFTREAVAKRAAEISQLRSRQTIEQSGRSGNLYEVDKESGLRRASDRAARARAEVEAARAARAQTEPAAVPVVTSPEPEPIRAPVSVTHNQEAIERRLLLNRAADALKRGDPRMTPEKYEQLIARHEHLAAPRPDAVMVRAVQFFNPQPAQPLFDRMTSVFRKDWDESKVRRHPDGTELGGQFAPKHGPVAAPTADRLTDGAKFRLPATHSYPELDVTTRRDGNTVELFMEGRNRPILHTDVKTAAAFLADVHGELPHAPNSGNEVLDNAIRNGATKLGQGNGGIVFDAGDKILKASSVLPFHWNNGLRSIDGANQKLQSEIDVVNKMIDAGVPNLVPLESVMHEGRLFAIRDKVALEGFDQQAIDDAGKALEAIHAAGYTLRDQVQIGMGADGKVRLFDIGEAGPRDKNEGFAREDERTDHSSLARFAEKHGLKYEGPDNRDAYPKFISAQFEAHSAIAEGDPDKSRRAELKLRETFHMLQQTDPETAELFESTYNRDLQQVRDIWRGPSYTPEALTKSIDTWMEKNGIDPATKWTRSDGVQELPPPEVIDAIAAEQQSHAGKPISPEALKSYEALKTALYSQFEAIQKSGLKVHAWKGEGEPYKESPDKLWSPNSNVMRQRVAEEKKFYFFMTQSGFGSEGAGESEKHPLLEMSPYKTADGDPMLANDVFRVVHDSVGHLYGRFSFSTKGEMNAMLSHLSTLPEEAHAALFAETFGQNAVYEKTGKFADQNTYVSEYLGDFQRLLKRNKPPQTDAGFGKSFEAEVFTEDSDYPMGAGRLKRQPIREQAEAVDVKDILFSRAINLFGSMAKGADCGANGPGGQGFQPGNTCAKEDGSGSTSAPTSHEWKMNPTITPRGGDKAKRADGSDPVFDTEMMGYVEGELAGIPVVAFQVGLINKVSKKTQAALVAAVNDPDTLQAMKEAGIRKIYVDVATASNKPKQWTMAHRDGILYINPQTGDRIAKRTNPISKLKGFAGVIYHEAGHGIYNRASKEAQAEWKETLKAHPEVRDLIASRQNIKPPADRFDDKSVEDYGTEEVHAELNAIRKYDPDLFQSLPEPIRQAMDRVAASGTGKVREIPSHLRNLQPKWQSDVMVRMVEFFRNCGTGDGGFQPGNDCADEDGIPNSSSTLNVSDVFENIKTDPTAQDRAEIVQWVKDVATLKLRDDSLLKMTADYLLTDPTAGDRKELVQYAKNVLTLKPVAAQIKRSFTPGPAASDAAAIAGKVKGVVKAIVGPFVSFFAEQIRESRASGPGRALKVRPGLMPSPFPGMITRSADTEQADFDVNSLDFESVDIDVLTEAIAGKLSDNATIPEIHEAVLDGMEGLIAELNRVANSPSKKLFSRMADMLKGWDESKHKRHGKGSDRGGEFAPKDGGESSVAFVAPAIDDPTGEIEADTERAIQQLDGGRHANQKHLMEDVDTQLGIESRHINSVGVWSDGAENSLMIQATGIDHETLKYATAIKAKLANQKDAIVFTPDAEGNAFLYRVTVKSRNMSELRKLATDSGLMYHTIQDNGEQGSRIIVFDPTGSGDMDSAVESFAEKVDADENKRIRGRGEFLTEEYSSRAKAGVKYDRIIDDYEEAFPDRRRYRGIHWPGVRDRRGSPESGGEAGSGDGTEPDVSSATVKFFSDLNEPGEDVVDLLPCGEGESDEGVLQSEDEC